MSVNDYLKALVQYGLNKGLIEKCDEAYIINRLLEVMGLDEFSQTEGGTWEAMKEIHSLPLEDILGGLLEDAVRRGICQDDTISRDLFDTRLMGVLTPAPREIRRRFGEMYEKDPVEATDWYYRFSQDTDYIRRYRVQKDLHWKTATEYGNLDITINLSKPEKDPRAIAAAGAARAVGYPRCQLCPESEGYAGRMNYPARQNHRIIPLTIAGEEWFFQYSPYVYYNEHCILLNREHVPMVIDRSVFEKLLDFVTLFPHYFVGSNADLPIVGGSILSHEHFQGGRYSFPMENAPIERELLFQGYEDIKAGIVKWPMSVIRLCGSDRERLVSLADKILSCWRGYSDPEAFIFAETEGEKHNTITPIARRRKEEYELDLVLRNNITTKEHPLGVYHPHEELHHIKKENIGLIEVMGLAVLPARLKHELAELEKAILGEEKLQGELEKHDPWVNKLKEKYVFTAENISCILKMEVGRVFSQVLEHAGVYSRSTEGRLAFERFVYYVNQEE